MDDLALVRRMAEQVRDAIVRYPSENQDYAEVIRVRPGDVTRKIDLVAEEALDKAVEAEGITAKIISEEIGERIVPEGARPEMTLLCDPVDGSNNFIAGLPYYCTTLALSHETGVATYGDIEAAAVASPHLGTFYAARGKGAFRDGHRIHTGRKDSKPIYAIYTYGSGPIPPGLIGIQEHDCIVRTMGSIALDICMVAHGSFNAVIDSRKKVSGYDVMAAGFILREAGGVIALLDGGNIDELPLSARGLSVLCISDEKSLKEMYREIMAEGRA